MYFRFKHTQIPDLGIAFYILALVNGCFPLELVSVLQAKPMFDKLNLASSTETFYRLLL